MTVAIVILNYNGEGLLKKYLGSVVKAAKRSVHPTHLIVLDNCSTDGSRRFIEGNFKDEVEFLNAEANLLLCSYNPAMKRLKEDIVILLNNDLKAEEGFIDPLIGHFDDERVFFVAPKIMKIDNTVMTGGHMDYCYRFGLFKNRLKENRENKFSLFVGSSAAYDRKKFIELGGYDPMYLPGTGEDLDLCYRAWQRGWVGLYEERAVVYHHDSFSFDREYSKSSRQAISCRNAHIFVWKNIRDRRMLFESVFFYPISLIINLLRMRFDLVRGRLWALFYINQIIKRRRENGRFIKLTDRKIKELFTGGN